MKMYKRFAAAALAVSLTAAVSITALADTTQPAPAPGTQAPTGTAGSTTTGTQTGTISGLTPSSPFYFLDRLFESIQLFFTRDPQARVNVYVRFADERLAELHMVTTQTSSGDGLQQRAAAQQLVSDVVRDLGSADTTLETAKLSNTNVATTAVRVQQVAIQGQSVIRQNSALPATLIPPLLQTLNQIAQDAGALGQVKVEAVIQAKNAGVQPGKLALTVKMAQNAGKDVTAVAPMMNAMSPADVAQKLGLDPNTFTKLAISISNSRVKAAATGNSVPTTAMTAPTASTANWNNQIALPGGVAKVLDYKYETQDGNVEYQVTYLDGSGQVVTYKYDSKDGKVETKLEIAGQEPGNSARLFAQAKGRGQEKEKEKNHERENEHESEHESEHDD